MLYGRQLSTPNSLELLFLVEDLLNDPTLPELEHPRTFALHLLLVDLIRDEFAKQCRIFDLESPASNETRSQALQSLERIVSYQIPELTGWMLLFYRYVPC